MPKLKTASGSVPGTAAPRVASRRSPLPAIISLLLAGTAIAPTAGATLPAAIAPASLAREPIAQALPQSQPAALPLTIYQPLQTIQWEGRLMTRNGLAYFALEPLTATYVSEQDLELARAVGDRGKVGRVLVKLALLNSIQEQVDAALNQYKAALKIAQETSDRELKGLALGSLGLVRAQKGFYDADTIEYLREYWQFTREEGDPAQEQVALGNLGNAYFGADLYVQAIEFHQKRLALAQKSNDRVGQGKALGDLGLVYQALGEPERTIDLAQQQLSLARAAQNIPGQLMALASLGIAYHTQSNYAKAIEFQQQRLVLAQQAKNQKAEAEALSNLGGAYYFLGDNERAIERYEQAWKIGWNVLHDADVLYGARGNQGLVYLRLGKVEPALEMFQQYFRYIASRQNRRGQGVVKNNGAVLRWQQGNLIAAEAALRESIDLWESLRSRLGNGTSSDAYKVSIFETQQAPYQNLQAVLLAQNKPEAALEIAERGRARAFAELLQRRSSLSERSSPSSRTPSAPNLEQIRAIAKQQNATLVQYAIASGTFQSQNRLTTQESELLIWVVQPTGQITFRRHDLKPLWQQKSLTLSDLVNTERKSIGVQARGLGVVGRAEGRGGSSRGQRLQTLYSLLIAPIADLLPADPNAHVIFIPHRSLFLVPFAALPTPNGGYLIQQHTLSIAPSIQVLAFTRQSKVQRPKPTTTSTSLIVGNPTMPKVTTIAGHPPDTLPSLPGAEQEARTIATLLKTQPLLGNQATKAAVIQRMTQANLIHLATHGLLDDFVGLGVPGAIALAPSGSDTGLLTANELLNLKLQADLVVLSACDTGRGRITGDGVIGLSRSLIAAGAPSVIVSLWAVPDAPTAALMTEFYQTLQRTPHKAQALRQSMLKTLQQYPDPRDWAAFTLIGEAD